MFISHWILCVIGSQWRDWGVMWSVLHLFRISATVLNVMCISDLKKKKKKKKRKWAKQNSLVLFGQILPCGFIHNVNAHQGVKDVEVVFQLVCAMNQNGQHLPIIWCLHLLLLLLFLHCCCRCISSTILTWMFQNYVLHKRLRPHSGYVLSQSEE